MGDITNLREGILAKEEISIICISHKYKKNVKRKKKKIDGNSK